MSLKKKNTDLVATVSELSARPDGGSQLNYAAKYLKKCMAEAEELDKRLETIKAEKAALHAEMQRAKQALAAMMNMENLKHIRAGGLLIELVADEVLFMTDKFQIV